MRRRPAIIPSGSGRVPDLSLRGMSGEPLQSDSTPPAKRDWSWLLGAAVSLAALVIAVWGLDVRAFLEVLARAAYWLLIPAYLFQLAGIASRAQGWRSLLGPSVGFPRAFAALNEGYLLNNILPFRLGELGRAYLVGYGTGIGTSRALGSIVVERMVDVFIAVLSLLVTLPLFAPPAWARRATLVVGLGLALLAIALILALRYRASWLARLRRLPGALASRIAGIAERFLIGLEEARKGARLGRAFLWLLLGWACAWIQILIYLRMFGAEGSFAVSVFCLGVIALGGAVPSSPGAVGVYELAGVAALTFLGYSREVALGVVVTAHLVQYSLTVILGAAALSREGRSLGDLARAARGLVLRPAA